MNEQLDSCTATMTRGWRNSGALADSETIAAVAERDGTITIRVTDSAAGTVLSRRCHVGQLRQSFDHLQRFLCSRRYNDIVIGATR